MAAEIANHELERRLYFEPPTAERIDDAHLIGIFQWCTSTCDLGYSSVMWI